MLLQSVFASPARLISLSLPSTRSAVASPVLSGSALLFSSSPGKGWWAWTGVASSGVSKWPSESVLWRPDKERDRHTVSFTKHPRHETTGGRIDPYITENSHCKYGYSNTQNCTKKIAFKCGRCLRTNATCTVCSLTQRHHLIPNAAAFLTSSFKGVFCKLFTQFEEDLFVLRELYHNRTRLSHRVLVFL